MVMASAPRNCVKLLTKVAILRKIDEFTSVKQVVLSGTFIAIIHLLLSKACNAKGAKIQIDKSLEDLWVSITSRLKMTPIRPRLL